MNELDLVARLAARAASETDPRVDVSRRVLQRIRRRPAPVVDRTLALTSLCACLVSAAVLVAVIVWAPFYEPAASSGDSFVVLSAAAVRQSDFDAYQQVFAP